MVVMAMMATDTQKVSCDVLRDMKLISRTKCLTQDKRRQSNAQKLLCADGDLLVFYGV